MSRWSVLGTNTWIAYNDIVSAISDGVTNAIGSAPGGVTGEQWLSSSQLAAWVSAITVPANTLQWCTKNNISLIYAYSYTFYLADNYIPKNTYCWSTSALACSGTRTYPITLYSADSTLVVGSQMYVYSGGYLIPFAPIATNPNSWAFYNGNPLQFNNNGTIAAFGVCSGSVTFTVYAKLANAGSGTFYVWYSVDGDVTYTKLSATAVTTGGVTAGNITVASGVQVNLFVSNQNMSTGGTFSSTAGDSAGYPSDPGVVCQQYNIVTPINLQNYFLTAHGSTNNCTPT